MLGCSQYSDSNNKTINLHSFSQLCQDSAAGCEQMIDTKNNSEFKSKVYNDDNKNNICDDPKCIEVPADNIMNVVYDKTKQCDQSNKGCQRLGVVSTYNVSVNYEDVYKNNDPDKYNTIICGANSVGCSEWSDTSGGINYFKDPGEMVCEWRQPQASNQGYQWLKKKTKTCGGFSTSKLCFSDSDCQKKCSSNGLLCNNDSDCPAPNAGSCRFETCKAIGDETCATSYDKTVGSGGSGGRTPQPANWAGLCEADQSGCTEYIDPTSKFNENLVNNPSYSNLNTDPAIEYWQTEGTGAKQAISLLPYTIYIIKGAGNLSENKAKIQISCSNLGTGKLRILDTYNNFSIKDSGTTDWTAGGDNAEDSQSIEFYLQGRDNTLTTPFDCTIHRSKQTAGESVYLRRAIVDYQLAQKLDRNSSNGLVNNDSGFVLFNERAQNGSVKKSLIYNADKTFETGVDGETPGTSNPKNANVILKVKSDRTCSKWLSCLTYIPDPEDPSKKICLGIGSCDKLASDGSCDNFIETDSKKNQTIGSVITTKIGNLSGYSKVGYTESNKSLTLADYYNLGSMSQVGEKIEINNGSFENKSNWTNGATPPMPAKILNQPSQIDALNLTPYQKIKNSDLGNSSFLVPDGRGILQLKSGDAAVSGNAITLTNNTRYVLTFYAYNTGNGLRLDFLQDVLTNPKNFTLLTIGPNDTKNKWLKYTLAFKAIVPSYKLSFSKTGSGEAYIDDVRLDPALNIRCDTPGADASSCNNITNAAGPIMPNGHCSATISMSCTEDIHCPATETCIKISSAAATPQPQYLGSSCRLYARENSLACAYNDSENIRHKGIYGYCLESDPKDPATCLLWYPISRIAGDQNEEAEFINFDNKYVYYCVDARDECNGDMPGFYCQQFIKVNKNYYWSKRMSSVTNS